jgi:hypothetical protein
MIQSLFIITSTGEIIIEKHWRGITHRNVCDFFVEEVNKYKLREVRAMSVRDRSEVVDANIRRSIYSNLSMYQYLSTAIAALSIWNHKHALTHTHIYVSIKDVPPVMTTTKHYLISAFREELFVLAIVTNEVKIVNSRYHDILPGGIFMYGESWIADEIRGNMYLVCIMFSSMNIPEYGIES